MITKKSLLFLCTLLIITLLSCQKETLCGDDFCQNGGECINNECVCATGYTGEYCDEERVPSSMLISLITVTDYPETINSGTPGYSDPIPDIYVKLNYNSTVVYCHPTNYSEAVRGVNYDFVPNGNIIIHNPDDYYTLVLMDKDDEADDLVAEQSFIPYQAGEGFPKTVKIGEEGDLSFELTVQYSF